MLIGVCRFKKKKKLLKTETEKMTDCGENKTNSNCLCIEKLNWIIIKWTQRNRWAWPVAGSVRIYMRLYYTSFAIIFTKSVVFRFIYCTFFQTTAWRVLLKRLKCKPLSTFWWCMCMSCRISVTIAAFIVQFFSLLLVKRFF